MKKFLLFAGEAFCPKGGMNDFKGSFDTIEEAEEMFNRFYVIKYNSWDWYQIVERETLEVVVSDGSIYGSD